MTEEEELQAKIDALSGKIQQAKQQRFQPPNHHQQHPPLFDSSIVRGSQRWSPYRQPARPRFSNRSLVVAANTPRATTTSNDHTKKAGRGSQSLQNEQEPTRELVIEGVRFLVKPDGSKLIRASDNPHAPETPKKATVAGITFLRTRQGNLARVSNTQTEASRTPKRVQCEQFTRHGTCPRGPSCKFAHDPNKIAICKDFLRSGSCPRGGHCDLSHEPTYHRAPACAHFLRGNCTNSACRYPHVKVSLSAPVCRAYASTGYCGKGPACDKRHVTECPDYANHGHCAHRETGQCKLPHTDHASTLRKAEQRRAKMAAGGRESDLSSDDEHPSDGESIANDDDSDAVEVLTGSDDETHALSQQQDFVSLS